MRSSRHHEERLDLLESIAAEIGTATVQQFSQRLFQERSWGPMAESETYAHLEHLRVTGHMTAAMDSRRPASLFPRARLKSPRPLFRPNSGRRTPNVVSGDPRSGGIENLRLIT